MKNKKGSREKEITHATIMRAIVSLGEQMSEMRREMATKEYVDEVREELRGEIRAIGRAVDKDAETLLKHERRITRVEKHLALK